MIDKLQEWITIISLALLGIAVIYLLYQSIIKQNIKNVSEFIYNKSGIILLSISILISVISFDEYGVSWDETAQWKSGRITYEYVFEGNNQLKNWQDRDYGVAFELPLIILEKILGLKDSRRVFLFRHLCTNLFFLFSAYFGFLLIEKLHGKRILAICGYCLLILHPRIYGHSFINTKDIPFMGMFIICMYLIATAFNTKSIQRYAILGIGIGLLINLRLMGLVVFVLVILFQFLDLFRATKQSNEVKYLITFIVSVCLTLYISWPYLWVDPINNFIYALNNLVHARYTGIVLFEGRLIKSVNTPWYYFPKWFVITTPIVYLCSGLFGSILVIYNFIKAPNSFLSNTTSRNHLFHWILFFGPFILILILQPNLYDGWRQLFFLYPPFILCAIYGLNYVIDRISLQLLIIISILTFLPPATFIVRNHPIQYVYFNNFVDTKTPEYLRSQYDLDYWGISYKQALEYVLINDSSPSISIFVDGAAGYYNEGILPFSLRKRINYVDRDEADYLITNYRGKPEGIESNDLIIWHSIKVGNNTVATIYTPTE